jgi:hypothetical protein
LLKSKKFSLTFRNQKLRSIKAEAQGEIDRFRQEKEAEYQRELEAVSSRHLNSLVEAQDPAGRAGGKLRTG